MWHTVPSWALCDKTHRLCRSSFQLPLTVALEVTMTEQKIAEYRTYVTACLTQAEIDGDPVSRARWEGLGKEWEQLAKAEEIRTRAAKERN